MSTIGVASRVRVTREISIDVSGKKTVLHVDGTIPGSVIDQMVRNVVRSLFLYVYVGCVVAECQMHYLRDSMEKKKYYRFGAKMFYHQTMSALHTTMKKYTFDKMGDGFCTEMSMTVYEQVSVSLKRLHDIVARKVANYGYKDVGVRADAFIVYNLICTAVVNYQQIMEAFQKRHHINLTDAYICRCPYIAMRRCEDLLASMDIKNSDPMMKKLAQNKDIRTLYHEIELMIVNEKVLKNAYTSAAEELDKEIGVKL